MQLYRNLTLKVTKSRTTSGASRKKSAIRFNLLLNKSLKCLSSRLSWRSGISNSGRRTVLSKGKKNTTSKIVMCSYKQLDGSIHFHHSYLFNSSSNRLHSLIFSSSGKTSYIRNSLNKLPFQLYRVNSVFSKFINNYTLLDSSRSINFLNISSSLLYLRFMSKVYNLQVNLKENVKYSRADHSYSTILKKNLQFFSVIVKLPSGVRKIFSIFSIGYKQELQSSPKNFLFDSSAKRLYLKGLSPRSRGVAKNPVDHPHGGRTKSLRYPRTPWGKTTKFK